MSNDKKIVIKINYPNKSAGIPEAETGSVEYRVEWNIKRISVAIAVLCILAALGGYLWLSGGENHKDKSSSVTEPPVDSAPQANSKSGVKEAAAITDSKKTSGTSPPPSPANIEMEQKPRQQPAAVSPANAIPASGLVVRASLAKSIADKEPVGNISSPLVLGKNGARTIYYFTELQNMSGKEIYHEWLYKGKSVFRRPIKITDRHWRTATHKTIRSNAPGEWTVRLTDEHGNIMHQIDFKVVAANNE